MAAQGEFSGTFRMRHQAEDIALPVADSSDVVARAVGVGRLGQLSVRGTVTEEDPMLPLQLGKGRVVAEVVALTVGDRDAQPLPGLVRSRERGIGLLDTEGDVLTAKPQVPIAQERAGQEPRLTEDLKAIADPDHQAPLAGKGRHCPHDGGEPGNRSRSQVVPVGEASRQQDHIVPLDRVFLVPDKIDRLPDDLADHVVGIVITIRSGEDDDAKFHGGQFLWDRGVN